MATYMILAHLDRLVGIAFRKLKSVLTVIGARGRLPDSIIDGVSGDAGVFRGGTLVQSFALEYSCAGICCTAARYLWLYRRQLE